MNYVTSIISTKGGVGKTTLCINASAIVAELGFKVLVIDCDAQQTLSKFYNYSELPKKGIKEFIINEDINSISTTHFSGVDIIVNNDPKETVSEWMKASFGRMFTLTNMLKKLGEEYDYIFIDTKGTDGSGQIQEMAIIASDIVVSPTTPALMSSQELHRTI